MIDMFSKKRKTIQLMPSTHARLKRLGKKGESFDSIIVRLVRGFQHA